MHKGFAVVIPVRFEMLTPKYLLAALLCWSSNYKHFLTILDSRSGIDAEGTAFSKSPKLES